MFRFDESLKVYLHRDPVDFRYGMNSLSILVEQSMRLNPMDASLVCGPRTTPLTEGGGVCKVW
ncbi:IS66 family insertion sequence element accessory protein TnpB [Burkholderia sp. JSH-S8]|nr:IS66 family insertion sequence element accessory protein TnpB [Burkholderia sp. JSH-S8]